MDNQNQNNIQTQTNQVPVTTPAEMPVSEPQVSDAMTSQPVAPTAEPVTVTVEPVSVEPSVSAPVVEPTVSAEPVAAAEPAAETVPAPQTVIEPVVPGIEPTGAPVAQDDEANLGLSDESAANTPAPAPTATVSPSPAPVEPTTPQAPSPSV
jgi:hypothetical protein